MNTEEKINLPKKPDQKVNVRSTFKINSDLTVKGFSEKTEWVPEIDNSYIFDEKTTLSILAGFEHDRRVIIQGYHGTGKSTHIEQVAARLNWPCIRINLDSHVSRLDLLGKDAIKLEDGKQITKFVEGILPWSIQNPVALVFDEYDAGRPDVMFVIQRVLEAEGNFTLLDKNKVISQNKYFRLFATSNTVGLGDTSGLYHGTQQINQGQMDRWNIVTTLNYLSLDRIANYLGLNFIDIRKIEKIDVAINTTANYKVLNSLMEKLSIEGKIVEASWYGKNKGEVALGGYFHSKRLKIISSQVSKIPKYMKNKYDFEGRLKLAIKSLKNSKLEKLITSESNFFDLEKDYYKILQNKDTIMHLVKY